MLHLSRHHLLLISTLAFILGIALYPYLPFFPTIYLITAIILTAILISIKYLSKHPHFFTFYFLLFTFLLLAISRGQFSTHIKSENTIDYYNDTKQRYEITGTIIEEPDIRKDKINYTIQVESLSPLKPSKHNEANEANEPDGPNKPNPPPPNEANEANKPNSLPPAAQPPTQTPPLSGRLLLSASKYPAYHYGDTLKITGEPITPAIFDTFDYAGYLSRYEIYSVVYRPKIEKISEGNGNPFWKIMFWVKTKFQNSLQSVFPGEPYASFMEGLLLGSRKGIPDDLSEAFRVTGLTHIIAISGYNITIIITILMALFLPLMGRKKSIILSGTGIILFTLFVGASPAVVRACIMGVFALLALHSQRKGQITTILALTVAIMIAWNPKILVYDIGFQLSFLATMGLIYVSPILEPYFKWLPEKLAVRESMILTFSAQVLALPVILMNFQNLSLISPLANLLVAGPIIPFTMLFGFLATVTGFIFLPLAKFIGLPAYLLLSYQSWIITTLSKVPLASVEITWFGKPLFFLYFIIITILLIRYWKNKKEEPTGEKLSISEIK